MMLFYSIIILNNSQKKLCWIHSYGLAFELGEINNKHRHTK